MKAISLFLLLALSCVSALADGPEEGRDSGGGVEYYDGGRDSGGFAVDTLAKEEASGRCVSAQAQATQGSACEQAETDWGCRQMSYNLIASRRSQHGCRWLPGAR